MCVGIFENACLRVFVYFYVFVFVNHQWCIVYSAGCWLGCSMMRCTPPSSCASPCPSPDTTAPGCNCMDVGVSFLFYQVMSQVNIQMAQYLTKIAMVVGSIFTRGNNIFSFPRSGNRITRCVEFRQSIFNITKIVQKIVKRVS